MKTRTLAGLALALSLFSVAAIADPAPTTTDGGCTDDQKAQTVTSTHTITIGGKAVSYSVTVGFLEITLNPTDFQYAWNAVGVQPAQSSGPSKACIFSTYYQVKAPQGADQAQFTQHRAITFAFNGGPGSASLWLHLGLMGPRRVNTGPEGLTPKIPFELDDNANSPLDLTDIVMIDPVGTGFSHPEAGSDETAFLGVQFDAESVASFIHTFIDQNDREDSPLYVLGESYGGIRGPIVAQLLQQPLNLPLQGLILVSPCLSTTIWGGFASDDIDVPYWTYFPSMAAIAHFHGRTDAKFAGMTADQVFDAASTFAKGPLRDALEMGNTLSASDQQFHEVSAQMHAFLGISQADIEAWNLRVSDTKFFSYALSDTGTGLEVGRYDGRYTGYKLVNEDGSDASDPSDTAQSFVFGPAIDYYLRDEIGFKTTSPYVDMANLPAWPWNADAQEYVATRNLSIAFADNPDLKVFVASGYYDMACPMGTVEYERTRLDPTSHGAERMFLHRYEGGHMMYTNPEALSILKQDLGAFYLGVPSATTTP